MQLERVYSDAQRAAAVEAYSQPGVSAARVVEMAAAGELTGEPFELNPNSVRDFARKARRAESRPSTLLAVPPNDAVEDMRLRAIQVADAELRAVENQPEGKRDLGRLREAERCIEGLKKIGAPAGPRPGRGRPPERAGGESSGQVGSLLAEHRAAPAPTVPPVAPVAAPVPQPSPRERLRAELRADIETAQREHSHDREHEPSPDLGEAWTRSTDRAADREARRRRRMPEEDTSSWR